MKNNSSCCILLLAVVLFACKNQSQTDSIVSEMNDLQNSDSESTKPKQALTYLALGDSYTIGEGVQQDERWPVVLAKRLSSQGISVQSPTILATTGWTTGELLKAVEKENLDKEYGMVSLLIGVNNQYRGLDEAVFEQQFTKLLDVAIRFAGNNPDRVFVVSIPDYGVTPFGQKRDPSKIEAEVDSYNERKKSISNTYGITFIDITDISRIAATDSELVAADDLHPSGKMYAQWVDKIMPMVSNQLK